MALQISSSSESVTLYSVICSMPDKILRTNSLFPLISIVSSCVCSMCAEMFSGLSLTIILPSLIMIISLHTALTSCMIWELNKIVCFSLKSRIKSRISKICFGSSPTVGSSKIRISGSPTIAPAIPTRCL